MGVRKSLREPFIDQISTRTAKSSSLWTLGVTEVLTNNSPKQNCLNFFRYKLEINNKAQTFVNKTFISLLVSPSRRQ